MADLRWMIYGASGYTGTLVAQEAVAHGHRPLLAGRDESKLRLLARQLGLRYVAFGLDDVNAIARHIGEMDVVYHAAGPFTHTSAPMIRACLATHTHYVDISGEVDVLEATFGYDDVARKVGVALISGAGFDVIPSDCLAATVAARVPAIHQLTMGIEALSSISAGTGKSLLEMLPHGLRWREGGQLRVAPRRAWVRTLPMTSGRKLGLLIPWGDIATAYRTTGAPNIAVYMALHPTLVRLLSVTGSMGWLFKLQTVKRLAGWLMSRLATPPNAQQRSIGASYLYARASNLAGDVAEAWLETAEGYQFTALCAVPSVERVASGGLSGALTPSQAFGKDFVLGIEGTRLHMP